MKQNSNQIYPVDSNQTSRELNLHCFALGTDDANIAMDIHKHIFRGYGW